MAAEAVSGTATQDERDRVERKGREERLRGENIYEERGSLINAETKKYKNAAIRQRYGGSSSSSGIDNFSIKYY